jgi:hypothetical protein
MQQTNSQMMLANAENFMGKTRSKSVDLRASVNPTRPAHSQAVLNTVNSFGLDPPYQRKRAARGYYQSEDVNVKSHEFRQLEAKNQLERERLTQIMRKLELDLQHAKQDLLEEDEDTYDDKYNSKRHASLSSSSLSTSGAAASSSASSSAAPTLTTASSYASTSPSINPAALVSAKSSKTTNHRAPPSSWPEDNYYENNSRGHHRQQVARQPGRAASFFKKPNRRHSIGSLELQLPTKPALTVSRATHEHVCYIYESPSLKQPSAGQSLENAAKLASKSVSHLPGNEAVGSDAASMKHQPTTGFAQSSKLMKGSCAARHLDESKTNEEQVKRTIENLSPLSISASSMSSSASGGNEPNNLLSASNPSLTHTTATAVSNTLVTQIVDEVGSIGRAFNRISSSSNCHQSQQQQPDAVVAVIDAVANLEDGYKSSAKCKFESFI